MSELCGRYQISRPTGYKWIDRIESGGLKAGGDRSRAPYRRPNRTPEHIERHRALGCSAFVIEFFGRATTVSAQLFAERVTPTFSG